MRRLAIPLAAAIAILAVGSTQVHARPAGRPPIPAPRAEAIPAQFAAGADDEAEWERRRQWREMRRARDEDRIAEAARREAQRIEEEREQRRAWRRAQRENGYGAAPAYGHAPGYGQTPGYGAGYGGGFVGK